MPVLPNQFVLGGVKMGEVIKWGKMGEIGTQSQISIRV